MIGIAPQSLFPLKYPKTDPSIPPAGAFAIPVTLDWTSHTEYRVSLNNIQQQKPFGSLRCIWIDNRNVANAVTIAVNGTDQIFVAPASSANYYAVINMNVPDVDFTVSGTVTNQTNVIFLNFVPSFAMQTALAVQPISGTVAASQSGAWTVGVNNFPSTQAVSGTVAVSNFPATQPVSGTIAATQSGAWTVGVNNFPSTQAVSGTVAVSNFPATQPVSGTVAATQSGAWTVGVNNFPTTQAVSGTVAVSNFPATQPVSGTVAATQSGAWTVGVNNFPATQPVSIAATVSDNIAQYGGVATSLGQKVSASSIPMVVASDQVSLPVTSSANVFPTLTLTTNAAQVLTGPSRLFIRSIYIVNVGAVLAAGTVTLSITDGSGFVRYAPILPVATATALQPYTVVDIPLSSIPLVNTGNNVMVSLSASLTSGSFVITCGVSLV